MPSLRQKVTTYFRQLSFIAEPRDGPRSPRKTEDDGNFITKYLEGRMERIFITAPEIFNGQDPTEMPDLNISSYNTGSHNITAACTGPDEGLTGIKRSKLHLSASYADDIDFIDTITESDAFEVRKSITTNNTQSHNKFGARINSTRKTNNDQNANKTNNANTTGMRSRKNSRTNISNLNQSISSTTKEAQLKSIADPKKNGSVMVKKVDANAKGSTTIVVSMVSTTKVGQPSTQSHSDGSHNDQNNKNLLNSTKTDLDGNTNIERNGETKKLLEKTTERLLREAVSNGDDIVVESIAGVTNWRMESECAYGISVSLYENNMLTKEAMGSPIADCYGMVVRGDVAVMALADGVNWGDGARLAARSAVHGCLDYLDRAIFGLADECLAATTQEVFVSLLRSLWEGHGCILEVGGALSTLTIAVVLPLASTNAHNDDDDGNGKYVVCACNVGDSLGFVYSKKYGVREFTQASHDITSMRDMRDALGAIGPADGNKPELSNLTFSMTIIEKGDIVFLTSDGISDNFDPVVGKFAEAWTPDVKLMTTNVQNTRTSGILAPKRQNKSAAALYTSMNTPPVRPPRSKKSASPENTQTNLINNAPSRPKYMRSHTVIEPRRLSSSAGGSNLTNNQRRINHAMQHTQIKIPKSITGLPLVTGPQRHALTLYRLEDLLSYGINGTFSPCTSARRLCHLLIDFVRMITSARRKTLEQREIFYKLSTGPDGIKREVELNRMQHRAARKRVVDSSAYSALPGKLDHATVVAYTVGGMVNSCGGINDISLQSRDFKETNF